MINKHYQNKNNNLKMIFNKWNHKLKVLSHKI